MTNVADITRADAVHPSVMHPPIIKSTNAIGPPAERNSEQIVRREGASRVLERQDALLGWTTTERAQPGLQQQAGERTGGHYRKQVTVRRHLETLRFFTNS